MQLVWDGVLSVVLFTVKPRRAWEKPAGCWHRESSCIVKFPSDRSVSIRIAARAAGKCDASRGEEPCSHRLERCSTAPSKPSHGKAALVQGRQCPASTCIVFAYHAADDYTVSQTTCGCSRLHTWYAARTSDLCLQVEMARIKALKQMEEAGRHTKTHWSSSCVAPLVLLCRRFLHQIPSLRQCLHVSVLGAGIGA